MTCSEIKKLAVERRVGPGDVQDNVLKVIVNFLGDALKVMKSMEVSS